MPDSTAIAVHLQSVSYKYPHSDKVALSEISYTFPTGTTAIVGPNGGGKSTLVKLLTGLLAPTAGSISVQLPGGACLLPDKLHKAVLFQEPSHLHLTIRQNITMRFERTPNEDARIYNALEIAGLGQVVKGLPDGIDTLVGAGFGGRIDLSGGQWQRLALARLIYQDAPVMILDEPVASLDPEGERAVFELFSQLDQAKVIIFTTHRYDSIPRDTKIVVLVDGLITESGTHEELLQRQRDYWSLYSSSSLPKARPRAIDARRGRPMSSQGVIASATRGEGQYLRTQPFVPGIGRGQDGAAAHAMNGQERDDSVEQFGKTAMRMELMAAIKALEATAPGSSVVIRTPSQVVQHDMPSWVHKRVRAGWRTSAGQPVDNQDLWQMLAALAAERRVTWERLPAKATVAEVDLCGRRVEAPARTAAHHAASAAATADGAGPGSGPGTQLTPGGTHPTPMVAEGTQVRTDGAHPVIVAKEGGQVSTGNTEQAGAVGPATRVSAEDMQFDRLAAPEMQPDTYDSRRHALLAECQALEQRWAEVHEEVLRLDQEWQHLVGSVSSADAAARNGCPPHWADGALLFHDLEQHAARTSRLAGEALQTCKQYAAALQQAMEGLP